MCALYALSMAYRVTVILGRSSDAALHDEGAKLIAVLPGACEVAVDPVKATLQVTVVTHHPSALTAARAALDIVDRGLRDGGLPEPESIVTVESEAVPQARGAGAQASCLHDGGSRSGVSPATTRSSSTTPTRFEPAVPEPIWSTSAVR